jgi:hypothetical protein
MNQTPLTTFRRVSSLKCDKIQSHIGPIVNREETLFVENSDKLRTVVWTNKAYRENRDVDMFEYSRKEERSMKMSHNLEDWKCQQEAKRIAAHKDSPLAIVAGGGASANKREYEEHRVSDEFSREAQLRHKKVVETTMKALRLAVFPDEIAPLQDALLKLNLTVVERNELNELLLEKNK